MSAKGKEGKRLCILRDEGKSNQNLERLLREG
jgi:hypothetical protein